MSEKLVTKKQGNNNKKKRKTEYTFAFGLFK
jgi:hypothetical protein